MYCKRHVGDFYKLGMNTLIMPKINKELTSEQREELFRALQTRLEKNMNRHNGLEWDKIQAKLDANTEKLWSLNEMERTGGEPDVVCYDKRTGESSFMIVQRKVLKAAEVFVTIVKRSRQGKSLNQKITQLMWRLAWALSF
jgi:uncharacterized protein DUF4256